MADQASLLTSSYASRFHEMINGAIIGGAQVAVGHPFDTIKTNIQHSNTTKPHVNTLSHQFKNLYKGVKYPALLSCGFNAGCFSIYTWGIDEAKCTPFISGTVAGTIMGAIATPFEYYKVQKQTDGCKRKGIKYWSRVEWKRWQPSIGVTMAREGLSTGVYFGAYEWMHIYRPFASHNQILSYLDTDFTYGGLSGCSSWLLTYPIDTLKTRRQSLPPMKCQSTNWYSLIMNGHGLYKGLGICMVRAFLVNGVTFWLYEHLHIRS